MSAVPPAHVEPGRSYRVRVVGPAFGGILFAYEIGRHIGCKVAFTARREDGTIALRDGFVHRFAEDEIFLLADDTITSWGTVFDTRDEIVRRVPKARFVPAVLALCNRSGCEEKDGMRAVSLVAPRCKVWQDGENPYTDGAERVPPVRKPKEHWRELMLPK